MHLDIENIIKEYNNKIILNKISYSFTNDKIYGIIGHNGCGKTSLLNIISGDSIPESGEVTFFNNDVEAEFLKNILYIRSEVMLPEFLTGFEFIDLYVRFNKLKYSNDEIIEKMDKIGLLSEDQNKLITEYSLGMKVKLEMLLMDIGQSPIILLDEPLVALDINTSSDIKKYLISRKSERIIIITTHLIDIILGLCDSLLILEDGLLKELEGNITKKKIEQIFGVE